MKYQTWVLANIIDKTTHYKLLRDRCYPPQGELEVPALETTNSTEIYIDNLCCVPSDEKKYQDHQQEANILSDFYFNTEDNPWGNVHYQGHVYFSTVTYYTRSGDYPTFTPQHEEWQDNVGHISKDYIHRIKVRNLKYPDPRRVQEEGFTDISTLVTGWVACNRTDLLKFYPKNKGSSLNRRRHPKDKAINITFSHRKFGYPHYTTVRVSPHTKKYEESGLHYKPLGELQETTTKQLAQVKYTVNLRNTTYIRTREAPVPNNKLFLEICTEPETDRKRSNREISQETKEEEEYFKSIKIKLSLL
jgi:hypothetical protein